MAMALNVSDVEHFMWHSKLQSYNISTMKVFVRCSLVPDEGRPSWSKRFTILIYCAIYVKCLTSVHVFC